MREPGHPGIRRRLNESAVCIWQEREQTIQGRENEVDSREQPQQRLERYFQRNQTSENTNPTASILMIFIEQVSNGKLPQRRHTDSVQIPAAVTKVPLPPLLRCGDRYTRSARMKAGN